MACTVCNRKRTSDPLLAAAFDEGAGRWTVETSIGERVTATYCIMATGCFSTTNTPRFEGLDSFAGPRYHTGRWPHEPVDFRGQRVGVIGTGSSVIQSIPIIARQARHLYVFQRTPNYAVPAHNRPLDPAVQARVKANYAEMRARAKTARNGIDHFPNPVAAVEASEDERRGGVRVEVGARRARIPGRVLGPACYFSSNRGISSTRLHGRVR